MQVGLSKSIYIKDEADWELIKSEAARVNRSASNYLVWLVKQSADDRPANVVSMEKLRGYR